MTSATMLPRIMVAATIGVFLLVLTLCEAWSADPPPPYAEMSNEELAERAYLAKARAELERRTEAARGPERDTLDRLLREAPAAEEVVADFTNAELVDLITSVPGAEANRAAYAVLTKRLLNTPSSANQQTFRELLVDRIADATYPEKSDQSEVATIAREEYVRLGHLAATFLSEEDALPIIKEMTIEQEMDGNINLIARMLPAIRAPGPDTIALVESVLNDHDAMRQTLMGCGLDDPRIAFFATLSHAGDPGLDALLRLGGWESDPLGLSVVASMPGDRPRDVLIAQYEHRRAEKGLGDPYVLQALARRLKKGDDPELVTFLRAEIPKHLVIPIEGSFNVPSLTTGVDAASSTGDPYYLPYLRDFLAAVDNGEGLHGASNYKSYPFAWRENVIALLDSTERAIKRLEKVKANAAEGVPGAE